MKNIKRTAMAGAIAAAFAPQHAKAATITVGGDGGVGSVTLTNKGDGTNIGGLLASFIAYGGLPGTSYDLRLAGKSGTTSYYGGPYPLVGDLFRAVRSSVTTLGSAAGVAWTFAAPWGSDGAVVGSADNWVPGHFLVPSVSGNQIWGWLHIELGSSDGDYDPRIISFTYDDAATDTTAFAKPVGGFQVEAVPEPSTFGLMALGLGAAGVLRLRRRKKIQQ